MVATTWLSTRMSALNDIHSFIIFFIWWCVYYLSSINGTQNTEMEEKTKIGVLLILKVVKSLV